MKGEKFNACIIPEDLICCGVHVQLQERCSYFSPTKDDERVCEHFRRGSQCSNLVAIMESIRIRMTDNPAVSPAAAPSKIAPAKRGRRPAIKGGKPGKREAAFTVSCELILAFLEEKQVNRISIKEASEALNVSAFKAKSVFKQMVKHNLPVTRQGTDGHYEIDIARFRKIVDERAGA